MQHSQVLLQTKHIFGARRWHRLPPEQWHTLKIPAHLVDQVLRIQVCKTAYVALFECQVAEQFPKDAYDHLGRGVARLGFSRGVLNVLHNRSGNAHLIFWDSPAREQTFHLDLDFANLSDFETFAVNQLRALTSNHWCELIQLLRGQSLGHVFYKTLRQHLGKLPVSQPQAYDALVDLVLKLLVLVFVQRKGWLNFDPYYVESKMEACRARGLSILQCFLRPLFARLEGAPVREWLPLGALPQLGGGLFQLEPAVLPVVPNDWLMELYHSVVSQFSFSLFESRENREVVGISPEVLGHVFENLLRHPDRQKLGTYFTPMSLALRQVDMGLGIYLRTKRVAKHEPGYLTLLNQIKVLDPSCGSGTYLVAAFQALLKRHLEIAPKNERYNGKLYELKRRIVTNNLFGVDIHPMAIRLTEVRLWLNMIQDLEIKEPEAAPPLPSLQHHLRAGDFLGQYRPTQFDKVRQWPQFAQLVAYRKKFPHAKAGKRQTLLRHIHRLEDALFKFLMTKAEAKKWRAYQAQTAQLGLPGQAHFQNASSTRPKAVPQPGQIHAMFCETLLDGGFDVIVGNPPWLSATKMAPGHRARIMERLAVPTALKLQGQLDLSIYFLVASLALLKDGGHLGFLMPGKLLQARFAHALRCYLSHFYQVDFLLDYGVDHGLIFQADTFPLALGVSRRKPHPEHRIRVERRGKDLHERFELRQADLANAAPTWVLEKPGKEPAHFPLPGWNPLASGPLRIKRGVVTGSKRYFVFTKKPTWFAEGDLRPLLRGRDLQEQTVKPGAWIYWPKPGEKLRWSDLTTEARRLLRLCPKVKNLGDDFQLPYRRQAPQGWCVVWKYLAREWRVALLQADSWVPDQTTYYLAFPKFEMAYRFFVFAHMPGVSDYLVKHAERGKDRFTFFYAHTVGILPVPADFTSLALEIPAAKSCFTPAEGRALWQGIPGKQRLNAWQKRFAEDQLRAGPALSLPGCAP